MVLWLDGQQNSLLVIIAYLIEELNLFAEVLALQADSLQELHMRGLFLFWHRLSLIQDSNLNLLTEFASQEDGIEFARL